MTARGQHRWYGRAQDFQFAPKIRHLRVNEYTCSAFFCPSRSFGETPAEHRPASAHSYQQSLVPRRWVTERDAQRGTPFGTHTERVMETRAPPMTLRWLTDDFRARAARLSGIQSEMRDALRRLGLPEDGPAVEQLTLLAIAPWCQVLVESRRLPRLTIEEAEEIGRAVTASLLTATRKGTKR